MSLNLSLVLSFFSLFFPSFSLLSLIAHLYLPVVGHCTPRSVHSFPSTHCGSNGLSPKAIHFNQPFFSPFLSQHKSLLQFRGFSPIVSSKGLGSPGKELESRVVRLLLYNHTFESCSRPINVSSLTSVIRLSSRSMYFSFVSPVNMPPLRELNLFV